MFSMSADQGECGSLPTSGPQSFTASHPAAHNPQSPHPPQSVQSGDIKSTDASEDGRISRGGSNIGGSDYGDFPLTPKATTPEPVYSTAFPAAGTAARNSRQGSYSIPRPKPTSYGANLHRSPSIMEAVIAPNPTPPPPPGTTFVPQNPPAQVPAPNFGAETTFVPQQTPAYPPSSDFGAPTYSSGPSEAGAPWQPAPAAPTARGAAHADFDTPPVIVPGPPTHPNIGAQQFNGQGQNRVSEPDMMSKKAPGGFFKMFDRHQSSQNTNYQNPNGENPGIIAAGGPIFDTKGGRSTVQYHEKSPSSLDPGFSHRKRNKKKLYIIIGTLIAIIVIAAAVGGGVGGKLAHDKAHANDPKPDGASCDPNADIDTCINYCSTTQEICVESLAVGDPCSLNSQCGLGLVCNIGACRQKSTSSNLIPVLTDQTCSSSQACIGKGEQCLTNSNNVILSGGSGYCGAQGCVIDDDCSGLDFFCATGYTSCGLAPCLTTSDCVSFLNARGESDYAEVVTCTFKSSYSTTASVCSLVFATATSSARNSGVLRRDSIATPTPLIAGNILKA